MEIRSWHKVDKAITQNSEELWNEFKESDQFNEKFQNLQNKELKEIQYYVSTISDFKTSFGKWFVYKSETFKTVRKTDAYTLIKSNESLGKLLNISIEDVALFFLILKGANAIAKEKYN